MKPHEVQPEETHGTSVPVVDTLRIQNASIHTRLKLLLECSLQLEVWNQCIDDLCSS